MAWVHVQKAQQATWEDYERVQRAVGEDPPDGLIVHAAGSADGTWRSVSVWESREAYERFRNERLMPAVKEALGDEMASAGPPPEEWFEAKHVIAR